MLQFAENTEEKTQTLIKNVLYAGNLQEGFIESLTAHPSQHNWGNVVFSIHHFTSCTVWKLYKI